jgi:hypothetical protein
MATQRRSVTDRRATPRSYVHLNCRFTFKGTEYKAFIKNLTSRDAYLWSSFMPPKGADILIRLDTPDSDTPLFLQGKIVRQEYKNMKQSVVDAFAVRFSFDSPQVAALIRKLTARPHRTTE